MANRSCREQFQAHNVNMSGHTYPFMHTQLLTWADTPTCSTEMMAAVYGGKGTWKMSQHTTAPEPSTQVPYTRMNETSIAIGGHVVRNLLHTWEQEHYCSFALSVPLKHFSWTCRHLPESKGGQDRHKSAVTPTHTHICQWFVKTPVQCTSVSHPSATCRDQHSDLCTIWQSQNTHLPAL